MSDIDWSEVEKAILTHFSTWTSTSIKYPFQAVCPSGETWLELHFLGETGEFTRLSGPSRGYLQLHIGIFSKEENQYSIVTAFKTLSDFLKQVSLSSTNYIVRFGGIAAVDLPSNKEEIIRHRACTVQASVLEKQ